MAIDKTGSRPDIEALRRLLASLSDQLEAREEWRELRRLDESERSDGAAGIADGVMLRGRLIQRLEAESRLWRAYRRIEDAIAELEGPDGAEPGSAGGDDPFAARSAPSAAARAPAMPARSEAPRLRVKVRAQSQSHAASGEAARPPAATATPSEAAAGAPDDTGERAPAAGRPVVEPGRIATVPQASPRSILERIRSIQSIEVPPARIQTPDAGHVPRGVRTPAAPALAVGYRGPGPVPAAPRDRRGGEGDLPVDGAARTPDGPGLLPPTPSRPADAGRPPAASTPSVRGSTQRGDSPAAPFRDPFAGDAAAGASADEPEAEVEIVILGRRPVEPGGEADRPGRQAPMREGPGGRLGAPLALPDRGAMPAGDEEAEEASVEIVIGAGAGPPARPDRGRP